MEGPAWGVDGADLRGPLHRAETTDRAMLITQRNKMKNTTSRKSATIISFLLTLPITIIYSLLVLNIEPDFGPLEHLLTSPDPDQPDVVGSLIVLGAMLLLPLAFVINLRVILRAKRARKSLTAHPFNLVLAVGILAFTALIVGEIIIDQYPCWIGVPNCD